MLRAGIVLTADLVCICVMDHSCSPHASTDMIDTKLQGFITTTGFTLLKLLSSSSTTLCKRLGTEDTTLWSLGSEMLSLLNSKHCIFLVVLFILRCVKQFQWLTGKGQTFLLQSRAQHSALIEPPRCVNHHRCWIWPSLWTRETWNLGSKEWGKPCSKVSQLAVETDYNLWICGYYKTNRSIFNRDRFREVPSFSVSRLNSGWAWMTSFC